LQLDTPKTRDFRKSTALRRRVAVAFPAVECVYKNSMVVYLGAVSCREQPTSSTRFENSPAYKFSDMRVGSMTSKYERYSKEELVRIIIGRVDESSD